MICKKSDLKRVENDFYATDPKSVEALLEVEEFEGSIMEPCCGQGHISQTLQQKLPNNQIYSYDLIYRGYGIGGTDFLTTPFIPISNVITNPPYKLAKEFIEKALKITTNKVAMLLRLQFLEGQARQAFFKNTPLARVYVFSKRQQCFREGLKLDPRNNKPWSGSIAFAWFVWDHSYIGNPEIRWI